MQILQKDKSSKQLSVFNFETVNDISIYCLSIVKVKR